MKKTDLNNVALGTKKRNTEKKACFSKFTFIREFSGK